MGRIIFFALIGAVAWMGWRLWRAGLLLPGKDGGAQTAAKSQPQALVECRMCGVHVPKAEALQQGEVYFCSAQHRDEFNATR